MKLLIAITIISSAICLVYSTATKEISDKVKATGQKCKTEHNVDDATYKEMIEHHKVPDSENGKCMIACFMKDMGYLHDGKFDIKTMEDNNKMKWDNSEHVEKANKADGHCIEKVGTQETNECELAHMFVTCLFDEAKTVGLPAPELQ